MEALFECVSGRVFGAKFTKGGNIWRTILRKLCERKLLVMVWEEKSTLQGGLKRQLWRSFYGGFVGER